MLLLLLILSSNNKQATEVAAISKYFFFVATIALHKPYIPNQLQREESNIRRHVINVFKEGELKKENNVHFLHVNGVKKPDTHYMWTKAFQANIIWNLNSKSLWKSQNQTGGSVGCGVL